MASYGIPTSFGFMDRYAGMGSGGEERELRLERAKVGLESDRLALDAQRLNYDTAKMKNEETQYQAGRTKASRSVLQSALAELDGDPEGTDTAAGTALSYPSVLAEISSLVSRDELEEAAEKYQSRLVGSVKRFRGEYKRLGTTEPSGGENGLESSLQKGALSMFRSDFDKYEVTLLDGSKALLGQLFGQNKYKDLRADKLRQENFDDGFIARYNSDDQFTRKTFRSVADPVLNMFVDKRSMLGVTNMAGGQKDALPLGMVSRYGSYLDRNFDDMRQELGNAGLSRLVQDAKDTRIRNGTYEDAAEFVRIFARNRRNGDRDADMALAVQDGLKAFDWCQKQCAGADGTVSDDAARTASKFARWAAEAGVTDFGNDDVRRRFGEMVELTAVLSRLDVPLFSHASDSGAEFRKAAGQALVAAQYGQELPKSNYFRRVGDFVTAALPLLTGGTAPANSEVAKADPRVGRGELAAVARATTGRQTLDNALARMLGTFVDAGVKLLSTDYGLDSASALRAVAADRSVVARWADDIAAMTGMPPAAAGLVASEFAADLASSERGLSPADLTAALIRVARNPLPEPEERAAMEDVKRWLLAEKMGDTLYADKKLAAVDHLMRTMPGMTRQQADAAVQSALLKDVEHYKHNRRDGDALDALANIGIGYVQRADPSTGYPVVRKETGDDAIVVPRGKMGVVEKLLKEAYGDGPAYKTALKGFVEEGNRTLAGAVPLLDAREVDFRKFGTRSMQAGNVLLPEVPPGLIKTNRYAFYQLHGLWRQMYEAQMKGAAKWLSKAQESNAE